MYVSCGLWYSRALAIVRYLFMFILGGHYYSRYLNNFYDAASDCEEIGGYLIKLDNINEMNYLISIK